MAIITTRQLQKQARRLDRRQQQIDHFVERMRTRNCALLCWYVFGRATFALADGTHVPQAVGRALAQHSNIVGVDLPLFVGALSQTFRWTDEPRRAL